MDDKLKFGKELVNFFEDSVSRDEAILALASRLQGCGYVRETFPTAVIEREKIFPTGLPTSPVGVAIPHTDTEHVIFSALAIGILSHSVVFQEMGTFDEEVNVEVISMLAISNPKAVIPVLSKLALIYQDSEILVKLKESTSPEIVVELLRTRIPEVIELV